MAVRNSNTHERLDDLLEGEDRQFHPWLGRVVENESFPTKILLECAFEKTVEARGTDAFVHNLAVSVLCARATDEIKDAAFKFLRAENAASRQLGAAILREFADCHLEKKAPFADVFIGPLSEAIAKEDDDDALGWQLVALTWQCGARSIPVLLGFLEDARPWVREKIADSLVRVNGGEDKPLRPALANAALELVSDKEPSVRWSFLYEVVESPRAFAPIGARLYEFLLGTTEEDEELALYRELALAALADLDPPDETTP